MPAAFPSGFQHWRVHHPGREPAQLLEYCTEHLEYIETPKAAQPPGLGVTPDMDKVMAANALYNKLPSYDRDDAIPHPRLEV